MVTKSCQFEICRALQLTSCFFDFRIRRQATLNATHPNGHESSQRQNQLRSMCVEISPNQESLKSSFALSLKIA